MHTEPYLRLVNREMDAVQEINWSHGVIWDMCWLSTLERFMVLDHNSAFLVDEHTLASERVGTSETRHGFPALRRRPLSICLPKSTVRRSYSFASSQRCS